MFVKKRVMRNLDELVDLAASSTDPHIRLVDGESGDAIEVDGDAIRAGFIAGIVVAAAAIEGGTKDASLTKQMACAMATAAEIYVDLRDDIEPSISKDE